jgi:hypothetical protein
MNDHICRAAYYHQDKSYDSVTNTMTISAPYCLCAVCHKRFIIDLNRIGEKKVENGMIEVYETKN